MIFTFHPVLKFIYMYMIFDGSPSIALILTRVQITASNPELPNEAQLPKNNESTPTYAQTCRASTAKTYWIRKLKSRGGNTKGHDFSRPFVLLPNRPIGPVLLFVTAVTEGSFQVAGK
jgi:hypothetical protein